MSIAVTPGPDGIAMSLGDGVPTRWLSIGRAIGQACLAVQEESGAISEGNRWILEATLLNRRLRGPTPALAFELGDAPPPIGTRLRATLDAAYTGAGACAPCHPAETGQWKSTPHASAYATLLSRRRQGVPGCFACHVTGYRQPTTGYRVPSDVALRHVQCESCHGPGSKHVKDPRRDNIIGVPEAQVCTECHTEKNSEMTDHNLADYRAKIAHTVGAGGHQERARLMASADFRRRLAAVMRLRCPRCLEGRVFCRFLTMRDSCPVCGHVFEREPGYFVGAMYVSYALAIPLYLLFVALLRPFLRGFSDLAGLAAGLPLVCLCAPFLFRYSRVIWMHFDWFFDPGA